MGKRFEVPVETVVMGSIASYHNDLFDPELFQVAKRALPSFGDTDFILVEINNDSAIERLRGMTKGRDVALRKSTYRHSLEWLQGSRMRGFACAWLPIHVGSPSDRSRWSADHIVIFGLMWQPKWPHQPNN